MAVVLLLGTHRPRAARPACESGGDCGDCVPRHGHRPGDAAARAGEPPATDHRGRADRRVVPRLIGRRGTGTQRIFTGEGANLPGGGLAPLRSQDWRIFPMTRSGTATRAGFSRADLLVVT